MKTVASGWTKKFPCKRYFIAVALFSLTAASINAHETIAKERYKVQGNVLFFDMSVPLGGGPDIVELEPPDVELFHLILVENPDVMEIVLTGYGGSKPTATSIATTILKFGMDTKAIGQCLSACTEMFLAGRTRTIAPDAILGFHRPFIESEVERAYFERYRDERGWEDEFDYVVWIYDVAQSDMLETSRFMAARGVSQNFIFEAFSYSRPDMWYPSTQELIEGGVVTQVLE